MNAGTPLLDRTALKFNQIGIITFTLLGYILDQPLLPGFVAAVLIGGSLHPRLALFKGLYHHALRPAGLMKADPVEESRAPHDFAQVLGGTVLLAATALLFGGSAAAGWALAWVVILLAATNLFFGFCAGCFVYYQLRRLRGPGSVRHEADVKEGGKGNDA